MLTISPNAPLRDNRADLESRGVEVREGRHLLAKWMDLTNLTTTFEHRPYGPCSKPEQVTLPIFMDAYERARAAFLAAGALAPCTIGEDAIRVYEFPRQAQVMFVFYRAVAGRPLEFSRRYDLTPEVIGFLKATGRWDEITSH